MHSWAELGVVLGLVAMAYFIGSHRGHKAGYLLASRRAYAWFKQEYAALVGEEKKDIN